MRYLKYKKAFLSIEIIIWFFTLMITIFLTLKYYNPSFLRFTNKESAALSVRFELPQIYYFMDNIKDYSQKKIPLTVQKSKYSPIVLSSPKNMFKTIPEAISFSRDNKKKVVISNIYYSVPELESCLSQCSLKIKDQRGYQIEMVFFKIAHIKSFLQIKGGRATVSGVIRNNKFYLSKVEQ
jgi:hypothetical protein